MEFNKLKMKEKYDAVDKYVSLISNGINIETSNNLGEPERRMFYKIFLKNGIDYAEKGDEENAVKMF